MGINGGRGFNECGARWRNYIGMFALIEGDGEWLLCNFFFFNVTFSLEFFFLFLFPSLISRKKIWSRSNAMLELLENVWVDEKKDAGWLMIFIFSLSFSILIISSKGRKKKNPLDIILSCFLKISKQMIHIPNAPRP